MTEESSTSLDALYDLLQKRKLMRVGDIAKHFNVSQELVIEWGKILEAGELATISKPRIGKPVIKIVGYTGEEPNKGQRNESSEDDLIKKKLEEREDVIGINKLIKNRNKGKINEAKKIILESRKRGYDNVFIRKMFEDKGWPMPLIDELLNRD